MMKCDRRHIFFEKSVLYLLKRLGPHHLYMEEVLTDQGSCTLGNIGFDSQITTFREVKNECIVKKHESTASEILDAYFQENNGVQLSATRSGAARDHMLFRLKFVYFNTMKNEWCCIPEGLRINVFNNGEPCPATTNGRNGVYEVCIFNLREGMPSAALNFTFETRNAWIYTKDKSAQPKFVYTYHDIDEMLPETEIKREDLACKRLMASNNFYDIPEKWDSSNWMCSIDRKSGMATELLHEAASTDGPAIFCLDDIVLTDGRLRQNITDQSADPGIAQSEFDFNRKQGTPKQFSEASRVRYLCFATNDKRLKLYSTAPGGHAKERYEGSIHRFACDINGIYRNYLHLPPANVRAVLFCGELYDVTMWRTNLKNEGGPNSGLVSGARAAIRNDATVHYGRTVCMVKQADGQNGGFHLPKGDYDIHYLHNCGVENGVVYGTLVVYWSTFFLKALQATTGEGIRKLQFPTASELDDVKSVIMEKAMDHWNGKAYQFVDTSGKNDIIIHPLFIFEANDTLTGAPDTSIEFEASKDVISLSNSARFHNALQNCSGGVPISISCIIEDATEYRFSSSRNQIDLCGTSLRIGPLYNEDIFNGKLITGEFGTRFDCFALADTLNHTTGPVKDRCKNIPRKKNDKKSLCPITGHWILTTKNGQAKSACGHQCVYIHSSNPFFNGLPLTKKCLGSVRMRNIWRLVEWINENSDQAASLDMFLSGQQFNIVFECMNNGITRKMYYYHSDGLKCNNGEHPQIARTPVINDWPKKVSASTAILTRLRLCKEKIPISVFGLN
jgi:hypothetical protein